MSLKVVEAIKIDDTHFETTEKIDDNINEVLIKFKKNISNKQHINEDITNIEEIFQGDIKHLKAAETSIGFWYNNVDDEVWNNV